MKPTSLSFHTSLLLARRLNFVPPNGPARVQLPATKPFARRRELGPALAVFARAARLALLVFSTAVQAATYYSQGSVDPTVLANWNDARAGGGNVPASFTSGDTFVVQNTHNMGTTAAWTVSGTGAKIQIESGGTLTANNLVAVPSFQVDNGGTYVHNAASAAFGNGSASDVPGSTSRSFGASSTVEFQKWAGTSNAPVALPSGVTWGNLKINVALLAGSWNQVGTLTSIAGNLVIMQTGGTTREFRFIANSPSSVTVNIGGDVQVSGGVLNLSSGSAAPTVNITGQLLVTGGSFRSSGTGLPVLTISGNSGKFTVTGGGGVYLTADPASPPGSPVADAITLDNGILGDDGVDMTLNTNRGITLNAGGGTISPVSGRTMTIPGNMTGAGALTKSYGFAGVLSGTTVNLTLSGTNDFAGDFTILGGGVRFNSSAAAGKGKVIVSMPSGGTANTTLRNTGVTISTLTNDVIFNANNGLLVSLDSDTVNTFVMSGKFSGVGSVVHGINAGGTVVLGGDNSAWSGGLAVRRGTTRLGPKNALGTGTYTGTPGTNVGVMPASLQAGTPLTGANAVTNAVQFSITNAATPPANFSFSGTNDLELSGPISLGFTGTGLSPTITNSNTGATILSGPISGTGFGLSLRGTGKLTLGGNNTYDGPTAINSGAVLVNGSLANGAVTVASGATLGGNGTINGTVTVASGGSIGAGAASSPGLLTLANGLDLSAGGINVWALAANSTANPGTDFDQISLTGGNLALGGSSSLLIQFIGAATFPSASDSFWQAAHSWRIIAGSGSATNAGPSNFASLSGTNGITAGTFSTSVDSSGNVILIYGPNPLPGAISLVSTGACWRYNDRGLDLGTDWANVGYEDSTWSLGFAPLGYGHGNEATVVSFGPNPNNKYITTYFRRTFDVPDGSAATNLFLRLQSEDGAAVYLNGVEVLRTNLPPGPLNYLTLASTEAAGTNVIVASISLTNLLPGENALAAEIHQAAPNGPDVIFDLALTGQFVVSTKPTLSVANAGGNNVVLAWPASVGSNFVLQSATTLTAPSWTAVSGPVVVAGGLRYVTNAISGAQRFYRLCSASPDAFACQPPVVLSQPLKVEVPAGTNVSLTMVVDGRPPFPYDWRKNQRSANGTNATLTLTNVSREMSGGYDVLICNGCECVFSCPIQLIVGGTTVARAYTFATRPPFPAAPGQLNPSNVVATTEAGEPVNPAGSYGRTVWLQWTAPASGIAAFDTKGSALATTMAVYTGTNLTNLVRQTYSGLHDRAYNSAVVFNAIAGTNYQVQLDGFGPTASLCLNWQLTTATEPAPQIVQQPQSEYVHLGSNATFTAAATLPPPLTNSLLSYQWFKEGIPITSATSSTFTLPATSTNIAQYFAAITYHSFNATSDVVTLVGHGSTVGSGSISPPVTSFAGQYSCPGSSAKFDHHLLYYFRVPASPSSVCAWPPDSCTVGSDLGPDPHFQPVDISSGTCTPKPLPSSTSSSCSVAFDTKGTNALSVDTLLYVVLQSGCSSAVAFACNDDVCSSCMPADKRSSVSFSSFANGNNVNANVSSGLIKVFVLCNTSTLGSAPSVQLNYLYTCP